ncbi:MAG: hypothetical protein ACTMKZ_13735 [Brevibacterium aurantiacum]|uniref:Uncharacterized protein n=1 Tax=Brevibacterium aurantiacum TaxID=273384 RepID=A0A2H1JUB4_BREAU|nr:hypothetical protein [Brevibacterium aurantiacum]SMX91125.1 hypothetical protein BAUR920_02491 [Brevibacterium aurantiacum]
MAKNRLQNAAKAVGNLGAVHEVDSEALAGGEIAVDLDTNTTAEADQAVSLRT